MSINQDVHIYTILIFGYAHKNNMYFVAFINFVQNVKNNIDLESRSLKYQNLI